MAASAIGHLVTIVWADEHEDFEYRAFARRQLARVVLE